MKLIFLMGPTASGKSEWAYQWATELGAAIFNADSVQVYKGLDIGSAKPSIDERKKVPHFLFDICEYPQLMTAGEYRRFFFDEIKKVESKFPAIIVVGGTGFYFQALERGLYEAGPINPNIRKELESLVQQGRARELYNELKKADPLAAEKISINDHYRIIRAVEILRSYGKGPTQLKAEQSNRAEDFIWPLLKIGVQLGKEELKAKIEKRTRWMLETGLVEEVQGLVREGKTEWKALQSIGYKEVLSMLNGQIQRDSLESEINMHTLQLTKKQKTWFKRDPEIHWFRPSERLEAQKLIVQFIEKS